MKIGIYFSVSYAMHIPVFLFVQQIPLVGMLMIPKTIAYAAIAFITYNDLYRPIKPVEVSLVTGNYGGIFYV